MVLFPVGGDDGFDGAVGVEVETVNTYLAMGAWALFALYVVFVDSVVDNVPLVSSRFLQDRVVCRTVYLQFGVLNQYYWFFGYLYRTKW